MIRMPKDMALRVHACTYNVVVSDILNGYSWVHVSHTGILEGYG